MSGAYPAWRDLPTPPGPPAPPMVPGHMGNPDERTCQDLACALSLAEACGETYRIHAEHLLIVQGVNPIALRKLAVRRLAEGRWPLHVSSEFLNPQGGENAA